MANRSRNLKHLSSTHHAIASSSEAKRPREHCFRVFVSCSSLASLCCPDRRPHASFPQEKCGIEGHFACLAVVARQSVAACEQQ